MVGTGPPFCFAGFRTDWPRREQAMKTTGRGTQTRYATVRSEPSTWSGKLEQSCSTGRAGEQKNIRPWVKCFFLTSPFIELIVHMNAVAATRRRKTAKAKVKLYEPGEVSARQAARPRQGIPAPQDAGPQEIGIKKGAFLGRPLASFTPPPRQGSARFAVVFSCRRRTKPAHASRWPSPRSGSPRSCPCAPGSR